MKKYSIILILIALFIFPGSLFAQRYIVATAHDTEGFQSGWSNEVYWSGGLHGVTLEWSANTEPDLTGYQFWVGYISGGDYMPSKFKACQPADAGCCTLTVWVEDPKNIELKGD